MGDIVWLFFILMFNKLSFLIKIEKKIKPDIYREDKCQTSKSFPVGEGLARTFQNEDKNNLLVTKELDFLVSLNF
jgi:hypothetical protein